LFQPAVGLTTIAALALVVAVLGSSSKNTYQSKKLQHRRCFVLASSESSKTVAADPRTCRPFANKMGQNQQSVFAAPDATANRLYDQTDMPAANATVSQNFELRNDAFVQSIGD